MALLDAKRITKKFSGLIAVDQVDLSINEGEIVGLIGPNGAGKTTFFNSITGFYRSDGGKVIFCGRDTTKFSAYHNCKAGMARTFQIVQPFGKLTALENVMVGAYNRVNKPEQAKKIAEEWLCYVQLESKADMKVTDMTIGDQRKLEMARAMATAPKLLLLDEVMAGLLPMEMEAVIDLVQKIRGGGTTVLMIEHIMAALMRISDRVVVLDRGKKIAEGTPGEISSNEKVIESYLGKAFKKGV
jgi:branched-chain amino acid transport system ATP-binding protein